MTAIQMNIGLEMCKLFDKYLNSITEVTAITIDNTVFTDYCTAVGSIHNRYSIILHKDMSNI